MKLSYNWLKELLPTLDKSPSEVAELLTLHSVETVVANTLAVDPQVTVAKIITIEAHPNADRLRLATIDTGAANVTVVCGAPNIKEGDIVPFSPPGTRLRDEAGKEFTLQETNIRGVQSPGMLNSPRELGLGLEHRGIYLLPAATPVGSKLFQHMPADTVLEADVTPNRAHDCLSHLGITRDLAALLELSVPEKTASLPTPNQEKGEFSLAALHHTPRYVGAHLIGVEVSPSPLWMQARLWAVGAKPINNVVDITNYVMFESGNPSHAFAARKLAGKIISARPAQSGEKLATLDGEQRELAPTNLVITSDNQPIAIAGVMGGQQTQVELDTQEIFLEVANFTASIVQESMRSLNLRTESSNRFAKGIDPNKVADAYHRCLELLQAHANAQVVQTVEHYPAPPKPQPIIFNPARVSRIAGTTIAQPQTWQYLKRLRCHVTASQVIPPTDRLDLTGEHDLIEEVIRLHGLENIPTTSPPKNTKKALPSLITQREALRDALAAAGFIEVYNYSFEVENIAGPLGLINENSLEVSNPVAPEQRYLRQSLLPRLLQNVVTNKAEIRKKKSPYSKSLFEVNSVFSRGEGGRVPGVIEAEHLAGVSVEKSAEEVREVLGRVLGDRLQFEHLGPLNRAAQLKLPYSLLREMPLITFELKIG